jgi:hypothetical protein
MIGGHGLPAFASAGGMGLQQRPFSIGSMR